MTNRITQLGEHVDADDAIKFANGRFVRSMAFTLAIRQNSISYSLARRRSRHGTRQLRKCAGNIILTKGREYIAFGDHSNSRRLSLCMCSFYLLTDAKLRLINS